MSFQSEYGIIMRFRGVNKLAWIPACAGTTGRENRERQGDKSGMTDDTSDTCYYDVLADLGLINKIDSYLSFPRVLGGIQSRKNC